MVQSHKKIRNTFGEICMFDHNWMRTDEIQKCGRCALNVQSIKALKEKLLKRFFDMITNTLMLALNNFEE